MKRKKTIEITIPGNPITKKNSLRLMVKDGRPFVSPSKQYKEYEAAAEPYLPKIDPVDFPCNVTGVYYMKTRRRVDLVNLLQGSLDLLSHHGVLADDNCRIVISLDGSHVLYDKENPRAEITIEEVDPDDPRVQDWEVKQ